MSIVESGGGSAALDSGEVQEVLDKISYARRARQQKERDWTENVQYMAGNFSSDVDPSMERVTVNYFWSAARTIVPNLYFKDPEVIAEAMRPQDVESAPIMESALNYYLRKCGVKRVFQKMIVDALPHSFGVCKVGYLFDRSWMEVRVDPKTGEVIQEEKGEPVDLTEFSIEKRPIQLGNRPIVARVCPRAILIDPKATGPDDAEWIAEEIKRHLPDVQADPAYKNTKDLKANLEQRPYDNVGHQFYGPEQGDLIGTSTGGIDGSAAIARQKGDEDLVTLYEFWDKRTRRLQVVSPGHDQFLRDDPWPSQGMEDFPYIFLTLTVPTSDELYPTPIFSVVKQQQIELNKIRSYEMDFIKRSVPKAAVDGSLVSKEEKDAFRRGANVPLIECKGPPKEAFQWLQAAEMNPEVAKAEERIKDDFRVITGLAEFMRGNVQAGVTATDQRLVAMSAGVSVDAMRDQVSDGIVAVCRALKALIQEFQDQRQIVKITGKSDFPWREFNREDVQGEYDVQLRAGTQLPMDPAVRQKMALDLFNLLAPVAMQGGPVDLVALIRNVLESFEIPDPERILKAPEDDKPPSDPHTEELLFAQGGWARVHPNDDDELHLQAHVPGLEQSRTPQELYYRQVHVRNHQMSMQLKVQAAQMQQQQAMGGGPGMQQAPPQHGPPSGPPTGPEPPPGGNGGGMPMGMGRSPVMPGFPLAPRQYSEKIPTREGVGRAAQRQTSPFFGKGPA